MANKTPLATILALFGSTCHYLEVTTKVLVFFPAYISNSPPVLAALILVNAILAVGYIIVAWHAIGWCAKALRWIGEGLEWAKVGSGAIAIRSLRYAAWNVLRAARIAVRWLR